jgi:hypothetical protein
MMLFKPFFWVFRRMFWLVAGFAIGIATSYAATRRLRRVAERYVPAEVVDRWSGNVKAAVNEGRTAMKARENALKAGMGGTSGQ